MRASLQEYTVRLTARIMYELVSGVNNRDRIHAEAHKTSEHGVDTAHMIEVTNRLTVAMITQVRYKLTATCDL